MGIAKKWRLREFYSAEYDSTMYIIQHKFLFWWNDIESDIYYVSHTPRNHELLYGSIAFYNKVDALDVLEAYLKYKCRLKNPKNEKIIEVKILLKE